MVNNDQDISEENILEVPKPELEEPEKYLTKVDILKKISSGTGLREALDNIVSGGMGALIVIYNLDAEGVFQGGFKVNSKFTSKRLTELAKMDGAIILSEDFKKILYANTFLIPDSDLMSLETGARHKTAERTAKQVKGLVIAVSQRLGKITLYYRNSRYVLQNTEDLLRRATETLQILEKQREVFDELITNLNVLEVTSLVSLGDVCSILQRLEMIRKMSNIVNEYIIELGKDGLIVRMRMRELTKGIDNNQEFIIKDYLPKSVKAKQFLHNLNFESLLDTEHISNSLFKEALDKEVIPKGYRLLSKANITVADIDNLVNNLKDLDKIMNAEEHVLREILKEKTEPFKRDINHLREQIMVGKKI